MLVNAVDSNAEFGVIGVTKKSTLIHYSVFHSRRMDTVFSCAMVATSAGYKTRTYLVPDIQFNMFSLPFWWSWWAVIAKRRPSRRSKTEPNWPMSPYFCRLNWACIVGLSARVCAKVNKPITNHDCLGPRTREIPKEAKGYGAWHVLNKFLSSVASCVRGILFGDFGLAIFIANTLCAADW